MDARPSLRGCFDQHPRSDRRAGVLAARRQGAVCTQPDLFDVDDPPPLLRHWRRAISQPLSHHRSLPKTCLASFATGPWSLPSLVVPFPDRSVFRGHSTGGCNAGARAGRDENYPGKVAAEYAERKHQSAAHQQLTDEPAYEQHQSHDSVVDTISDRFGTHAMHCRASQSRINI